ncbi:MAG: oxygen-insensitive NAD(P)H nitroreductase [Betaproteobacteria bacterium]|nr:oxygen-insensitive NAD(P)H nitroreductase [Betaproteobacteria bacterium]MCL2885517.1 oxygen-insensitive NAD(P)H nitroreductase [Betaproteobacteria bacterium]
MTLDITRYARARYAAKAYDPARKIPAPLIEQLRTLLRLAPSAVNAQPWHFVLAATDAGKARIAKATHGPYAYNAPKITAASHVFVLCTRHTLTDAHLETLMEQETRDGRLPTPNDRQMRREILSSYVDMHRYSHRDANAWMEKQTYIALGFLLLGAAQLELDATPIEGFDSAVLDRELGLRERGFVSSVIVPIGYHGADDFNANLPKSRLAAETLFTDI